MSSQNSGRGKVVFVSGDPGVGKTTLANMLGEMFSLPVFSKDAFKEPLLDVFPWADKQATRSHGAASYAILGSIIRAESRADRSIVIESPFTGESTGRMKELQEELRFAALEILCRADPVILLQRLRARASSRHPGHFDAERLQGLQPEDFPGRYDSPLGIDSTVVRLDLSDFSKLDKDTLLRDVAAFLEAP